jgi:hypothetical protein
MGCRVRLPRAAPGATRRGYSPAMSELLRWLGAGTVGVVVTFALFVAMTRLVDGPSILEGVMRIFPLILAPPTPEDECAARLASAVTIEGVVGEYRDGIFHPRSDAETSSDDALGGARKVDVAPDGSFRFVTAFPRDVPTDCPAVEAPIQATTQRLLIRAPGCQDRSVPVTRAWLAHRVVLDCG